MQIRHARAVDAITDENYRRRIYGRRRQAAPWETGVVGTERAPSKPAEAPEPAGDSEWTAAEIRMMEIITAHAEIGVWPSREYLREVHSISADSTRDVVQALLYRRAIEIVESDCIGRPRVYRLVSGPKAGAVLRVLSGGRSAK